MGCVADFVVCLLLLRLINVLWVLLLSLVFCFVICVLLFDCCFLCWFYVTLFGYLFVALCLRFGWVC